LTQAEGNIPLPGVDETITVKWNRRADGIHFSAETPVPIVLHIPGKSASAAERIVSVKRKFTDVIQP
jgi:hypothetical protein